MLLPISVSNHGGKHVYPPDNYLILIIFQQFLDDPLQFGGSLLPLFDRSVPKIIINYLIIHLKSNLPIL